MPINPFFLQGSQGEQRLVQDIINEQLRMYGIEVLYLPRKIVKTDNIFREVESSGFNDNFAIEAYVNTYEGYTGAGDIMTKFGMSLKDDLVVTISKERFEDFIGPFLQSMPDSEIIVDTRPREGDLIYFPLGKRIFEVKFVEHEKPFYQLGKNYVYELQCELFELEDEMGGWDQLSTTSEEIDDTLSSFGYMTELQLISAGSTATLGVTTSTGYIRNIILNNDGYDYTQIPTVTITPAPVGGTNATAVAITTSINNVYSVEEILLTNTGAGYTVAPTVTIVSAATTATNGITTTHGVGAAATATLVTSSGGIGYVSILESLAPTTWNTSTVEENYWNSVTYGNGKFVAVSEDGTNRVMWDIDGKGTWTPASATEQNDWTSVTYGNDKFVAVSRDGTNRVMYSSDGITWSNSGLSGVENNTWYGVTYGNDKFVAVSSSGTNRVMYSSDGISWTAASAAEQNNWTSVTYGNDKFVAVSSSGTNRVMYSSDGISWTAASAPASVHWTSVTYGNGKFVAVSKSSRVMYSFNGIDWLLTYAPEHGNWYDVTYGDGYFVAICCTCTDRVMSSFDGISWTAASATVQECWYTITYGNGNFVALSGDGSAMYSSITPAGNSGYPTAPQLYFTAPTSGSTATGRVLISTDNKVDQVLISDAGIGYTTGVGIATVAPPPIITGIGTYFFNDVVTGSLSGAKGRVKSWDKDENILKLGTTDGTFVAGDVAIGSTGTPPPEYTVDFVKSAEYEDKYDQSDEIEAEADAILDFSESNPFGQV